MSWAVPLALWRSAAAHQGHRLALRCARRHRGSIGCQRAVALRLHVDPVDRTRLLQRGVERTFSFGYGSTLFILRTPSIFTVSASWGGRSGSYLHEVAYECLSRPEWPPLVFNLLYLMTFVLLDVVWWS